MTHAKDGYAFMRVVTPSVAREYEIPLRGKLIGLDRKRYEELQNLAELHRTSIQSSPYEISKLVERPKSLSARNLHQNLTHAGVGEHVLFTIITAAVWRISPCLSGPPIELGPHFAPDHSRFSPNVSSTPAT